MHPAVDGIELTEEQQQQYRELKQQADEETAGDRALLSQEQMVLSGRQGEVEALQEQVADMQAQQQTLGDQTAQVHPDPDSC